MKRNTFKFLTLGGVLGSILFTTISLLSGYLQADYNPLNNFVSELGATNSSTEFIMNRIGFIPSGILFSFFGISLLIFISKKTISKIASLLIIVFGIGMSLAGIYSCDLGCPLNGTFESVIHDRVSAVTFISAILGILLMGFAFKKNNHFRKISLYSILTGFTSSLLLIMMISSFESKNLTGLWQRLLLLSIFTWTIVVGLRAYKKLNETILISDQ